MEAIKKTLDIRRRNTTPTDGGTVGEMEHIMKKYEIAKAIRADLLANTATEEARAQYRGIRKTYAAARDALITCHENASRAAETVAALVEGIGYENAAEIVAMMVICKGDWDGRIDNRRRAWAADLVTLTADELRDVLNLYYSDSIHPAHLDQIAAAMMAYTPAETTEAPETTESTPESETPAEAAETPVESESPATVRTLDLLDELDTGDHGDRLNDYRDSDAYICDAITEIADADTSIYYSDILDFIRENPETLAEVIRDGLYDPREDYDIFRHAQAAEFMTIERDIYDHLADSLMCAAVHFIRYDLNLEEIPAELAELLREWCDDADDNDRMNEIPDRIREWCEECNETAFDAFCASQHCASCKYRDCKTGAECRARFEADTMTTRAEVIA